MSDFDSILLPLDGSPEAAKGAGCALWLADALGGTLHVAHATAQPLPAAAELARLQVPEARGARLVVHQIPGDAAEAVLEEIATHGIDLVLMSARGASASEDASLRHRLGQVARAVIERSPVPVVLLPARYREELPWTGMLAAASGEAAADQALDTAVRLAAALRLKVKVLHCECEPSAGGPAPLSGAYADALHHEYPRRLEQLVERGLTGCPEHAHCVDEVLLRRGDPAAVLLEESRRLRSSVLALGWHGALDSGRAPVLRRLLDEAECALLLVRRPEGSPVRLRVGSELDED